MTTPSSLSSRLIPVNMVLGAALLQNNRQIAFASKTLTYIQTRYANIERIPLCLFWP